MKPRNTTQTCFSSIKQTLSVLVGFVERGNVVAAVEIEVCVLIIAPVGKNLMQLKDMLCF